MCDSRIEKPEGGEAPWVADSSCTRRSRPWMPKPRPFRASMTLWQRCASRCQALHHAAGKLRPHVAREQCADPCQHQVRESFAGHMLESTKSRIPEERRREPTTKLRREAGCHGP
ncbi:hypothetical protein AK812_SmicGene20812 [Symbiodinium microadriaticum]|uniref:Uncharacterized protein n=1 Tax=Symbiodinium microadriaticum TaxID=2951 RepID=A0A1Q9DP01_SYMMI|nr:hypothetical protein AK812_SmicGene20812 [Symbiodinium microadriaticum]